MDKHISYQHCATQTSISLPRRARKGVLQRLGASTAKSGQKIVTSAPTSGASSVRPICQGVQGPSDGSAPHGRVSELHRSQSKIQLRWTKALSAAQRVRSLLLTTARGVPQFFREANEIRKDLSFPSAEYVAKLTVVAVVSCVLLIGVVAGIDWVFYKFLAQRQFRKWGLANL